MNIKNKIIVTYSCITTSLVGGTIYELNKYANIMKERTQIMKAELEMKKYN